MTKRRISGVESGHKLDLLDDRHDDILAGWLEGLSGFGCVFLNLPPNQKHPNRTFEHFESIHQDMKSGHAQLAKTWLIEGRGLGFLLRGGLWVLDVDSPEWVDRVVELLAEAAVFPPFVNTPSGGVHFYFRLPAVFRQPELKHHVCHPLDPDGIRMAIDFKLGPRSLVVAPGVVRKGKIYSPACEWREPPELAPTFFGGDVEFFKVPPPPFAQDRRPLQNRISRACKYLSSWKTPVSVSGRGGRQALASVASHLVAFLGLDPHLAAKLLTGGPNPWNSRCRRLDGSRYPWRKSDLRDACAVAVGSIPAAGVALFRQEAARGRRDALLTEFLDALIASMCQKCGEYVRVEHLRHRFQEWSGEVVTRTGFGLAVAARGIERKKFSRLKVVGVESVVAASLDSALLLSRAALINRNSLHL